MNDLFVFDDGRGRLSPMTDLRASFDVRTGAMTTLERMRALLRPGDDAYGLVVPDSLAAITRERHPGAAVNPTDSPDRRVLLVNGRAWGKPADSESGAANAQAAINGKLIVDPVSGCLVMGEVRQGDAQRVVAQDFSGYQTVAHATPANVAPQCPPLIERPWHVRSVRDGCLRMDLALLMGVGRRAKRAGTDTSGPHWVTTDPSARVHPTAVLDSESGAILIDEHAVVHPLAIIHGPAYIGPHSHVLDRALIKPNTAIGPHCKVAGEVGGTIFQGYANKAHDGHLGDSWVGEWANLGAGTTNSNLLNTYGEVVCRGFGEDGSIGPNERTGETFLGTVIGDHCKFAICTRIMTGAIVGTGTMWAATAPVTGTVAPFTWATDSGVKAGGFRFDKFMEVARAAMARRKLEPSEAYIARLRELSQRIKG